MAVLLVVGFAKPEKRSVVKRPPVGAASPAALVVQEPVALSESWQRVKSSIRSEVQMQDDWQSVKSAAQKLATTKRRPVSYATGHSFDSVIGTVPGRRWLKAGQTLQSDDWPADWQAMQPLIFKGVGFPDIQSHRKPRGPYDPMRSDRSHWNPMIAWRQSDVEKDAVEPIAYVRCMGLTPQAVARRADRYESLIIELAMENEVSASLIKAVVTEESCFNNKALSPVGAQGLMQLMPDTASWLKVKNPKDPEDNLRAGIRYLAYLQGEFDTLELALAAYNAGPGNVRRYQGVPPFAETQSYVQKVQQHYRRYVAATRLTVQ